MPKHATRKNNNNAMNLGLFLGGLGLITAFLAILTITTVEAPAPPAPYEIPEGTAPMDNPSPEITVEVQPSVTLEVTP